MLPPGESRKRKDRESTPAFYSAAAKPVSISSARLDHLHKPNAPPPTPSPPSSNNGLLAGYLAYEFLTRGTILGEKFDPAAAAKTEAVVPFDSRRIRKVGGGGKSAAEEEKKEEEERRSTYAEVASILKTERAHIPGIVNPTQLARWIRM